MENKKKPKRRLRFLPKKRKKKQVSNLPVKNKQKRKKKKHSKSYYRNRNIILIVTLVIALFLGFSNRQRLRLMMKGYTFHDAGLLIKSKDGDISDYLKLKDAINMEDWEEIENDGHYYDYYLLKKTYPDVATVVTYIDGFYTIFPKLQELGYDMETCRKFMDTVSVSEFRLLVDHEIEYEEAKPYLNIPYCLIRDIEDYLQTDAKTPEEAIMEVSYRNVNSSKQLDREYVIVDPEQSKSVLVKEDYNLKQDYEPKDLVEPDVLYAYGTPAPSLRKEAAKAYEKMVAAAEKKDLQLVVTSSYRSYADQDALYDAYVKEYGYAYIKKYCLPAGCSEHQLGTSLDLTSYSVLIGEHYSFGDTDEFKWLKKNAHKYGFILRYPESKENITGVECEPWHIRYVGKEIAEEMYEDNLTLEEYILENGFDYSLAIQS